MGKKGQHHEGKDGKNAKQVERNTRSAIKADKKSRRKDEEDEDHVNFQAQLQVQPVEREVIGLLITKNRLLGCG